MLPFRNRRSDQKVFEFFFLCASEDVVCKVWCWLVEKCGRSREKTVLRFSQFLRKKIIDAYGRGLCQKMQQTPVNMCVQVFDCGRFGVGVISPNAFSEHSFGQLGDEQFPRLWRPLMATFCRRYTISSFIAPPNCEISLDSIRCVFWGFWGF